VSDHTTDDHSPATRRRGLPVFGTLLAIPFIAGLVTGLVV
jgi:hypothetical protein